MIWKLCLILYQNWKKTDQIFTFVLIRTVFFIYPIPTRTIPDGLKVVGSYIPRDVKASDEMSELLIPREYEALLWTGVASWIYKYKKQYDEANIAQQTYENEKAKFKATS